MEWFTSGVINAIAECRQNSSLLVVYVKDLSEASNSTNESWEDETVQEVLSGNVYVALQLVKDSVEFNQFSQLFPVFVLPSVFCISPNGDQLSVFSGPTDAKQLVITLTQAFQELKGTGTLLSDSFEDTDRSLDPVDKPSPLKQTNGEEIDTTITDLDAEEREEEIKKYREKMAKKQTDKYEEEKQREKSNELRRRKEGREVGEWKKDQEDRERQRWIEERNKDKVEKERARQEVLNKLKQDKLERQMKRATTTSTNISDPPSTIPSVFSAVRSNSSCKIQVKLPDARSTVLTFESSETVGDLRSKVAENLNVNPEKVILTCVYPRKELGLELDSTCLDEHDLVPSGVVLARVLGKSIDTVIREGTSMMSLMYGLFQFIVQLFVSMKNGIVGLVSSRSSTPTQQQLPADRQPAQSNSRFRRVKADDDNDDPDKTYNGNSTQQL